MRAFYTSSAVGIVEVSITTRAPFPNSGTSFRMIKASNVIASVVPIKLTDVKTSLTDTAPIIETFFPRLFGFYLWVLEPFRDRAYNLTIAKLTPDSSISIKSLKQISRIFCPHSYRRFRTLSVPLSEGNIVFFSSHV